ncbi:RHS repeat-associated core domain-containing protein [Pseudomonas arsenicoxydans]|uniref:RHS repeat-associated core domain-containing protein n=1 Tax=Pseudomonas arsenicoxydans TaxID=702115 RepID=A0A502GW65_9PSED|nr:RHS repeat-associated core domain-containing protein [Pseudomonas arsenicoxydans]TPG65712.1 hypothetical protein EAH78_31495 [Pseudomonas arsenicoxydans]
MSDNSESGPVIAVVAENKTIARDVSSLSAASANDIYSQATGVNLDYDFNARTGRIESSVVLGTVSSGFASPVTFNYTISLGVFQYYGLIGGLGRSVSKQFGLNMPKMSPGATGRVHFSSGLVDNQNFIDGSASLEAHRERDVNIEPVYTSEVGSQVLRGVKVIHINGIVEYYDAEGRIKEMRSESGHGLKFTVAHNAWLNTDIITRVEDDEGLNWITASVFPDQSSSDVFMDVLQHVDGVIITTRVVLGSTKEVGSDTHNNVYAKKISLPGDMQRWIEFSYDTAFLAGQLIKKVSLPTGQFIKVSQQTTLKFSDEQTLTVGSRVERGFEVAGVENVSSMVSYTYGTPGNSNNFTGYKVFRTMEPMVDNCSTLVEDYTYTVMATHRKSKVTTIYNRFHLPISCTTVEIAPRKVRFIQGIVTAYTYPIVIGAIDAQPANFSRWTQMTVDHQRIENITNALERSRRDQATRAFDEYGNLTSQTLPSGVRHEYVYYGKNSTETVGCPPCSYVRFLKRKTIHPKAGLPAPSGGNHTDSYTYIAVTCNSYINPLDSNSTVTPSMTLKKTDKVNDGEVAEYKYVTDQSTPFLLGSLKETVCSRNNVENKTMVSWSLSIYQGWRVVEATSYIWATGQATNTFAGSVKFSPLSGLVYEEEDSASSNTVFSYNQMRRLLQAKKYYGTPSEEVESYEFRYWSKAFRNHVSTPEEYHNTYTNRVKVTSSTGKITCWHFDHEGEPVFISHGDNDDFTQVASVTVYDRSNGAAEVIRHENIDYVTTSPIDSTLKQVKATTTYEHRLFGTERVVNPDGTALNSKVNKAATPFTTIVCSDATREVKSVQKFNDFGDVYETQIIYPSDTVIGHSSTVTTSTHAYDGYGRVIATVADGTTTDFTYDQLNRLTMHVCGEETTEYTYGNNLATVSELIGIKAIYKSTDSSADLTMMDASRSFDNFGRVIEQREPNYDSTGTRKVTRTMRYSSPTAQVPIQVSTGGGGVRYAHSTTGLLDGFRLTNAPGFPGQLHSAHYSLVSKQLTDTASYKHVNNADRQYVQHSYEYDDFGTAKTITTMFGINTTGGKTLNTFSRFSTKVESTDLQDQSGNSICKESSIYDATGRLTKKEFVTGGGLEFHATISYYPVVKGDSKSGKPKDIKFADTTTTLDVLRIDFAYDKFGNESDRRVRVMVAGNEHEALTFNQVTGHNGNATRRTIAYKAGSAGQRKSTTTDYEYTASKKYLSKSTISQGAETYDVRYEKTAFSAVGGISYNLPSTGLNVEFTRHSDQPSSMTNGIDVNEVRTFSYDGNGNVNTVVIVDQGATNATTTKRMKYNAMNQLLEISKDELAVASYDYDFFGKLVRITDIVNDKTCCLLYGADGLLGEVGDAGENIARTFYINVGGVSIGRYVQKVMGQSSELELFATDSGGTVHAVHTYVDGTINPDNAVSFTYLDDGLRSSNARHDQLDCPIGFKGYYIDSATGCYILGDGFRFYDPVMRQFWSVDSISPFGGAGPNRYHYCGMDPINRSDHSGNDWGWGGRLNRPWWKRWGWVLAETLMGAALGALAGFAAGGPAGAVAGAIAGGVLSGLGASLQAAAEEVILADSASRTDPTRGDYYIPPLASHLDKSGFGFGLGRDIGLGYAGSGVAKPALVSKVGQAAAASYTSMAGSRAGTAGTKGVSAVATGGKQAVSGPSRALPGMSGSNVRSSLQQHATTGGFKGYGVTLNNQPHTIYLSKTRTNGDRVAKQILASYLDDPGKSIHTLSGVHGELNGRVGQGVPLFWADDIGSGATMRHLAAKNNAPAPQISHTDIGRGLWQTSPRWAQQQLVAAPALADSVIYAFCHSGLNNELRASLGIKKIWAPWRWHG